MVLDVRSDSGAIRKITKPDDHIILQVSGFLIFASEVNVDEGGVARYTRQVDQRRVDDRVRRTVSVIIPQGTQGDVNGIDVVTPHGDGLQTARYALNIDSDNIISAGIAVDGNVERLA